jgi:nitrile hydratase
MKGEIHSTVSLLEKMSSSQGAKLVARAWVDPKFKELLLKNASAAGAEMGIVTTNPNAPTVLIVVENTDKIHNLCVCTLCSCYPSSILGLSPSWYKSRSYRSRAVKEPRAVLAEFGTILKNDVAIIVHDSTADTRYMVLPERPKYTENFTEDELASIVTRDSLIGVTRDLSIRSKC